MPDVVRELLHVASPFAIDVEGRTSDSIRIKGFASVETEDRSGDVVPPEEFRIEQFMASPSLLVNHRFWNDTSGNRVAAGRPLEMFASKLVKVDDDADWGIYDLKSKSVVSTYPKAKVPNLKSGDRGLFVIAEITQPEVVRQVEAGELSAFSWRGLTTVDYRVMAKSAKTQRVLTNIDIYEISITHVPDNVDSTFTVAKSAHLVTLSKSRFESKGMALEYLKAHQLATDAVREDETAYYSQQLPSGMFNVKSLEVMKMAEGVSVVAGPMRMPDSWTGELLEQYDSIATLFVSDPTDEVLKSPKSEDTNMADETVKSQSDDATDEQAKEVEKKAGAKKAMDECPPGQVWNEETEKCEASKEAQALEALAGNVAEKTATHLVDGLKPMFEAMTTNLTTMNTTMGQLVEKIAPDVEKKESEKRPDTDTDAESESEEVSKSAAMWDVLNSLATNLKTTQAQLVEVTKSAMAAEAKADAVAKSTPAETVREERVKSAANDDKKNDDPNTVFDSSFAFLMGERD